MTMAQQINAALGRLGAFDSWLVAYEEATPAHVLMAHPTRRFALALYDGPRLLAGLAALPEGTFPLAEPARLAIRGVLEHTMIDD